jgi:hypothetical protein
LVSFVVILVDAYGSAGLISGCISSCIAVSARVEDTAFVAGELAEVSIAATTCEISGCACKYCTSEESMIVAVSESNVRLFNCKPLKMYNPDSGRYAPRSTARSELYNIVDYNGGSTSVYLENVEYVEGIMFDAIMRRYRVMELICSITV